MKTLVFHLDYIIGRLRWGHMEVTLDDEAYERFLNAKSDKERREIIDEFDPEVLVDDYDIDDYSEPDFKNYSVCGVPVN